MLLNFEVGARVKLATGHDHKLIPGYYLVTNNITQVQRDKLSSSGPKYGCVTRVFPDKCAYEVMNKMISQARPHRYLQFSFIPIENILFNKLRPKFCFVT